MNPGTWAMTFLKGLDMFILTNFLWGMSSPKELFELWGSDIGDDPKDQTLAQHMIHWGAMTFTAQLLALFGVSTMQIVGFTYLFPLKFFSEMWLVNKKIETLPLVKKSYGFWTVLFSVAVATLLL